MTRWPQTPFTAKILNFKPTDVIHLVMPPDRATALSPIKTSR
jgi:hypothetical protein